MATASIPRPSIYKWGENFQRFLERFTEYASLITPPDRLDLLLLSMLDAQSWDKLSAVKMEPGEADANYKSIALVVEHYKAQMEKHADRRSDQAAFTLIKQSDRESIAEYAHRVDELAARAYPTQEVRDEIKAPTFIRGIRESRIKLALVTGDDKSYDDLVKTATRCEQANIMMQPSIDMRVFASSIEDNSNHQSVAALSSNSNAINQQWRGQEGRVKQDQECWSCGQKGAHLQKDCEFLKCYHCDGRHMVRECPLKPNGSYSGVPRGSGGNRRGRGGRSPNYYNIKCTYCQRVGHLEANCWSKNEAQGLNEGARHESGTRAPQ